MTQRAQPVDPSALHASCWLPAAILAAVVYLALVCAAFDFTIDDSFISMRYADNLARYAELVWNQGETAKVEGYSNLLWVLLLAPLYRLLPWDQLLITKVLSIVFGVATVVIFSVLAYRMLCNRVLVLCATLLLAVARPFVLWGCSGMETTLYTFLVCLAAYLLLVEETQRLSLATPVVLFLLCLTRTEGVVFFASAFSLRMVLLLALRDRRYAWSNRRWLLWNAVFFLLAGAWLTWKYLYYGSITPLPVHLKGAVGLSGVFYVRDCLFFLAPFVPLMIAGTLLGASRNRHHHVVFALAFYFAALCFANPVMGLEYRLLLAAVPLVILLSMLALSRVIQHHSGWQQSLAAIAVCAFLMYWSTGLPWSYPAQLHQTASNAYRILADVHIPLGKWLSAMRTSRGNASVALADAGATAFYSKCKVIDFFGLNDVEFARVRMTPDRLLERVPDFIVLKSRSQEKFAGTDTDYGRLSDIVYAYPEFHKSFRLERVWVSPSPFYCLWLFGRQAAAEVTMDGNTPNKALQTDRLRPSRNVVIPLGRPRWYHDASAGG